MIRLRVVGTLIVMAVLIAACGGSTQDEQPAAANPAVTSASPVATAAKQSSSVENSIEYKVAVVDAGGYVDPDDSIVSVYRSALSRAESNCSNSKQELADMAVKATQILADNGIQATALEMVEAVNDSVAGLDAGDCTEVYAVLITLMING